MNLDNSKAIKNEEEEEELRRQIELLSYSHVNWDNDNDIVLNAGEYCLHLEISECSKKVFITLLKYSNKEIQDKWGYGFLKVFEHLNGASKCAEQIVKEINIINQNIIDEQIEEEGEEEENARDYYRIECGDESE